MIYFDKPITIKPPPYSDTNGNLVVPAPIIFQELSYILIDDPKLNQVIAQLYNMPLYMELWKDEEYISIGDWTQKQADDRLLQILGDNPAMVIRSLYPQTLEETPNHPGTILSKMIKSVGIYMTDNCSCKEKAIQMNNLGNDWCEENIDLIVSWLKEEAKNRGLPFMDAIGKLLVSRAIKKSRKLLANEPIPENDDDLDTM